MSRMISIYKGKQIDTSLILKVKQIITQRSDQPIYSRYFEKINNVSELAYVHNINPNDEILVLGDDWFLFYQVSGNNVVFLDWLAADTSGYLFKQTIEMMKTFKSIFLANIDKQFIARMRHNTSYQFYLQLLKRGFSKEVKNALLVDMRPDSDDIIKCLMESFWNGEDINKDYSPYIFHNITFTLTKDFVKVYSDRRIAKK